MKAPLEVDTLERTARRPTEALRAQDISPPGHVHRVRWAGVPGATEVEVESASLVLSPADVRRDHDDLPLSAASDRVDITIPGGERVRSLTLSRLRFLDATDLVDQAGLSAKAVRLVVSVSEGGAFSAPLHAVPPVSGGQMMPAVLAGASYGSGVLRLPDLAATKLRLNLTQGDTPTEFSRQPFTLAAASGVTLLRSRNVSVLDPDGQSLFSVPGELPAVPGGHVVDLRHALEQHFERALAAQSSLASPASPAPPAPDAGDTGLEAAFTIVADPGCQAFVRASSVRGALLRVTRGVVRTTLAGGAQPLELGAGLAAFPPTSARGDLTLHYAGLRILGAHSDEVPVFGGTAGSVVGSEPVLRAVPSAALSELPLARVGVIGRAPVDCELSLALAVDAGGVPGPALGPPVTLLVAAADELCTHWFDLPLGASPLAQPILLVLHATSGRFLWAGEQQPLARLAVRDPDPGGRALLLGGRQLLAVTSEDQHLSAFEYPAEVFAAGAPHFESELFLDVDVSDLTLRYAR